MSKLDNIIINACIKVIDRDAETLGDYVEPAKEQIKALYLELTGAYSDYAKLNQNDYNQGVADVLVELRKKIEAL